MQLRALGRTGLTVSAIGFGTAAIGRPGYINLGHDGDLAGKRDPVQLEKHVHTMLDAALAAGITYVDAARSYGRAEEFVASWLTARSIAADSVVVGSKWGYVYTADWRVDADVHEVKVHTRGNLDRQHASSHGLLGGHLRIYQVHSATLESGVLENPEVVSRLAELRDLGLIIGLSTSGPRQADTIRRALNVEVDGNSLFGTVQATWNLLEPSVEPALEEAAAAGVGIIVKEAVANGRLTSRNGGLAKQISDLIPQWPLDAISIAAALHRPWASVVLSGAATPDQLSSNLRALDVPSEATDRLPPLMEAPDRYWQIRSGLAWQ